MPFIQHIKSSSSTPTLISTSISAERLRNNENISGDPFLLFVVKPNNKIRFRYSTEKGSHGVLTGYTDPSSKRTKKVYPTIQLQNYFGKKPVFLQISLYTVDEKQRHVFYLHGKDCENEICKVKFGKDLTTTFQVSIGNRKREEVLQILRQRKEQSGWSGDDKCIEDDLRNINLNAAKLCLEAYVDGEPNKCLCRTFSDVIFNSKSTQTGDLKICRLSKVSGSCSGGEEIFLFCDKVKKENIKIHFYEEKDDDIIWEDFGIFAVADWHHQVALVFKTPRYKENVESKVWIELLRTTDSATSEPREFLYLPDETDLMRKRKRIDPSPDNSSMSYETLSNESAPSEDLMFTAQSNASFYDVARQSMEEIDFNMDFLSPEMSRNYEIPSEPFSNLDFSDIDSDIQDLINPGGNTFNPDYFLNFNPMNDDVQTDAVVKKFSSITLKSKSTLSQKENEINEPKTLSSSRKISFKEVMFETFSNGNIKYLLRFAFHLMDMKDKNGNSLLHLAVIHQGTNLDFISKFLELTPQYLFNYPNKAKKTPLHIATEFNNLMLVKLLLLHGAKPTVQDSLGENCIHIACKRNFAAILKEFLSVLKNLDDLSTSNYEGFTPLHICVIEQSCHCLKLLVDFGADLNVQDKKSGRTPLHFAIQASLQIFKYLMSQPKIDKNIEDFSGKTIFNYAESSDFLKHEIFVEAQSTDVGGDSNGVANTESSFEEKSCVAPEITKRNSSCDSSDESINGDIQNDSILFLSHSEVLKLCTLMDPPCNAWKSFAMYLDLQDICDSILRFEPESPTKALLKKFQNMYTENQLEILKNMLNMAQLTEAAKVLEKN